MQQVNAYLTFNGNCREAMTFYQQCLGGELRFQTLGESIMAEKMPLRMREAILHSMLVKDKIILFGSDMVGDEGLVRGNAISLVLQCDSEEEIQGMYSQLSAGGKATHPLEENFWGTLFGNLIDKYGNQWLLQYEKKPS